MNRPNSTPLSIITIVASLIMTLMFLPRLAQRDPQASIRSTMSLMAAPMSAPLPDDIERILPTLDSPERIIRPRSEVILSLTTFVPSAAVPISRIKRADILNSPVFVILAREQPAAEVSGLTPEAVRQLMKASHTLTPEEAYRLYLYGDECFWQVSTAEEYLESIQRIEARAMEHARFDQDDADYWHGELDDLEQTYQHCRGYVSPEPEQWNEQQFDWLSFAAAGGVVPAQQDYYSSAMALLVDEPELMIRRPRLIDHYRQTAHHSLTALLRSSPEMAWQQWSLAWHQGLIVDRDPTRSLASLMLASLYSDQPSGYDYQISQMIAQMDDAQIHQADQWLTEHLQQDDAPTASQTNL